MTPLPTVCAADLDPSIQRIFVEVTPKRGRHKMTAKVERVLVSVKEDRVEILVRFYDKLRKRFGHHETLIRRKTDPIPVLSGKREQEMNDDNH